MCHDREIPEWAHKLSQQIIKGTGYTKEKGGVKDQRGYRDKLYCVLSEAIYWGVHDQVRGVQRMVSW